MPAGEVVDPVRTIPRATIYGVLLAACVYMAVSAVTMGVLPAEQLSASSAPLADVARLMWGEIGGVLVAVGAVIATFGTLNGFTLLTGQVPGAARWTAFFRTVWATCRASARRPTRWCFPTCWRRFWW